MSRPLRFLLLSMVIASVSFANADDLNRHLQDNYLNKTLILHGFYSGSHLRYDPSGSMVSGNRAGDWTSDGFVTITDVGIKKHEIRMTARRMSIISENKTLSLRVAENEYVRPGDEKGIFVEIKLDLQKKASSDQVDAAMGNVFLSSRDHFANMLPDYWKPCVWAALAGNDENCRFAPEVLAVPGMGAADAGSQENAGTTEKSLDRRLFRVEKGITPPRLNSHKEPEFSDLARRMKYQGTDVLALSVGADGVPTNIHVLNPLGCGLDAQAVRTVEGWRFKPAERDGQPGGGEHLRRSQLPLVLKVSISTSVKLR